MVDREIIFGYNIGAPLIKCTLNAEIVTYKKRRRLAQKLLRLLLKNVERSKFSAKFNKPEVALISCCTKIFHNELIFFAVLLIQGKEV